MESPSWQVIGIMTPVIIGAVAAVYVVGIGYTERRVIEINQRIEGLDREIDDRANRNRDLMIQFASDLRNEIALKYTEVRDDMENAHNHMMTRIDRVQKELVTKEQYDRTILAIVTRLWDYPPPSMFNALNLLEGQRSPLMNIPLAPINPDQLIPRTK